ncbi:unnamed protein product [Paramecium primaurelia]|uniref:Tetratricopeptide repeat protein n=1 Tax=Paramecium primaurelia TaxID=5886 RepID=A0A8S1QP56_PARPR|nr:unnamed protein product [Paramecium primaurelia]
MSQIMREYMKKCSSEGHDFVQFACLNQSCNAMRIYCFQCIQNGDHFNCHKHLKNLDQLFEFFKQIEEESEKLIEKIWFLQESIRELFLQLTKKLRAEFHFSKSALLEINPKKLSEALDKVIKYDEFKTVFLEDVKKCSDDMILQLNRLISQFEPFQNQEIPQYNFNKTEQLNNSQVNKSNQQQIEKSYQQGKELLIKDINYFKRITTKKQLNLQIFHYSLIQTIQIHSESLRMCKDYDGAIIIADKVLKIDSNHANSLYTKADSLRLLGDYQNAIAFADKALLIDPKHTDSLYTKIESLRLSGDYKGAIIQADEFLLIDPNNTDFLYTKDNLIYLIQILDQALNCDPDHELCLASKGACLNNFNSLNSVHSQLKYQEAIIYYNKAIEINPQYSWAKNKRAECKYKLNTQQ